MECPLLVWMLALNRDVTTAEYDTCYHLVRECAPYANIPYSPTSIESFRKIISQMLPLLMMRHRRISRSKWKHFEANGKHWIEQASDDMPPEKFLQSMIGYHLSYENSLCGMVMTQGRQRQVVNIGLGLKQLAVEPREMSFITPDVGDEVALRRLCIILSLKAAYVNATVPRTGCDLSRIEFNIPNETARIDDHPLQGWEFRVYKAQLGVARTGNVIEESYQCACAFFRGTKESKFIWHDNSKDLEAWVQFINIDQMVKVIPKLTA